MTLSPLEREIARRIAAGRLQKQVAAELGLSRSTVAWYVARLARRLPGDGRPAVKITRYVARHGANKMPDAS